MENVLDSLRKQRLSVTPEIIDTILEGSDILIHLIDELETNANETANISQEGQQIDLDALSEIKIDEIIAKIETVKNDSSQSDQSSSDEKLSTEAEMAVSNSKENTPETSSTIPEKVEAISKTLSLEQIQSKNAQDPVRINEAMTEALEVFLKESEEVLELEKKQYNDETINPLFRAVHTMKGNARYLGFSNTEQLAHHMEIVMDNFRTGKLEITPDRIDLFFKCLDTMQNLIKQITKKGSDANIPIDDLVSSLKELALEEGKKKADKKTTQKITPQKSSISEKGVDKESIEIFLLSVEQHIKNIENVYTKFENNAQQDQDYDCLIRACSVIKNSANYMTFNETKELAENLEELARKVSNNAEGMTKNTLLLWKRSIQYIDECFSSIRETVKEKGPDPLLIADLLIEINNLTRNQQTSMTVESQQEEINDKPTQDMVSEDNTQSDLPDDKVESSVEESSSVEEYLQVDKPEAITADTDNQASEENNIPDSQESLTFASGQQKKVVNIEKTIRVDQTKLDNLMNLIGELKIQRNSFTGICKKLENDYNVPEITNELKEATYMIGRISDDLQSTIMSARMLPVGTVFNKFTRQVRDLAKANKKEIILNISGEDTELDKTVIEQIGDPLVHLIRNSADHGLESAEDRVKKGKPEQGNIYLRSYHEGNSVVIEIEDDGKGIDTEKIKKKALEKGVINQSEYNSMAREAAIDIIFTPGFSTAEKISNISGRGVGMDVVRNNINKLNGRILVETEIDKGTKFTMILPLM